jgi:hypothetical protein
MSYRSKRQPFYVNGKLVSYIGQQCTYDRNGNLITNSAGAGTPDFVSGDGIDGKTHKDFDVKPWYALGWQEYNKTWRPDTRGISQQNK